jgi:SAM-dependent methyltransferase
VVTVNEEPISMEHHRLDTGGTVVQGYVTREVLARQPGCVRVAFELEKTVQPRGLQPGSVDDRWLGIALHWLEIEPSSESVHVQSYEEGDMSGLHEGMTAVNGVPIDNSSIFRRVIQLVCDLAQRPLSGLRILDLACAHGAYANELAARGASVVAIEGREEWLRQARARRRPTANVEFVNDDVRHLCRERYGEFDIVLCLGILYHLDTPDVFELIERIADVCRSFGVFETHVAAAPLASREWRGKTYWGQPSVEHAAGTPAAEKLKVLSASLDNEHSFWMTRASLLNVLRHVGFTSVSECQADWPEDPLEPYLFERGSHPRPRGRMRKILFFFPFGHRSGSEVALYELIRHADRGRVGMAVACGREGALFKGLPSDVAVFNYGNDAPSSDEEAIERLHDELRPDVPAPTSSCGSCPGHTTT